jgi:hypothetical protein
MPTRNIGLILPAKAQGSGWHKLMIRNAISSVRA